MKVYCGPFLILGILEKRGMDDRCRLPLLCPNKMKTSYCTACGLKTSDRFVEQWEHPTTKNDIAKIATSHNCAIINSMIYTDKVPEFLEQPSSESRWQVYFIAPCINVFNFYEVEYVDLPQSDGKEFPELFVLSNQFVDLVEYLQVKTGVVKVAM